MDQMTVCQTCGDKGFSILLIPCVQCQIVAVHRYCMDGPSTIDEEEVIWYCEDCLPRVIKHAACRKSERVSAKMEAQLQKRSRRKCTNNLNLLKAEKSCFVKESANEATTNVSELNNKSTVGILDNQKSKMGTNLSSQLSSVVDGSKIKASSSFEKEDKCSVLQPEHKCTHSLYENENASAKILLRSKSSEPLKYSTGAEMGNCETVPLIRQKKLPYTNKVVRKLKKEVNSDAGEDQLMKQEKTPTPHLLTGGDSIKESAVEACKEKVEVPMSVDCSSFEKEGKCSVLQRQHNCTHSSYENENASTKTLLRIKSSEPLKYSTGAEMRNCETEPLIRQKKRPYTNKVVRKLKKVKGNSDAGEDQQMKQEKTPTSHLFNEGDSIKGSDVEACKEEVDVLMSDGEHKHWPQLNEIHLKPPKKFDDLSSSKGEKLRECADKESEVASTIADFLDQSGEDMQSRSVFGGRSSKKKRLVIEMEYSDDESVNALTEPAPTKPSVDIFHISSSKPPVQLEPHASSAVPAVDIPILTSLVKLANHVISEPSPPLNNHAPCQPIIDVIWRGCCGIRNNIDPMSIELEAHLSNNAIQRVHAVASALPKLINFELVPQRYAWPKNFKESPPTGDNIGLYFFPVGERDERFYDYLLAQMIDHQLMLISQINNLELLVFCSRELPVEAWRFQSKYYLWGVFRQILEVMEPSSFCSTQISNTRLSLPSDFPSYSGYQEQDSDVHHKALCYFPETVVNDNLKHRKFVYCKRTYASELDIDRCSDKPGYSERTCASELDIDQLCGKPDYCDQTYASELDIDWHSGKPVYSQQTYAGKLNIDQHRGNPVYTQQTYANSLDQDGGNSVYKRTYASKLYIDQHGGKPVHDGRTYVSELKINEHGGEPVYSEQTYINEQAIDKHGGFRNEKFSHQTWGKFSTRQAEFDGHAYDAREVPYHAKVAHQRNRGSDNMWAGRGLKRSYQAKMRHRNYRAHDSLWVSTRPNHIERTFRHSRH